MAATAMKSNLITLEYSFSSDDNPHINSNVGKPPLIYTQGANQVIPGVETAVEGMTAGETKHVVVASADGFGPHDPNAAQEVYKHNLPRNITGCVSI